MKCLVLDGIPPDGHPIEVVGVTNTWAIIFANALMGILLVFSIICLCFNIIFRNKKLVNCCYEYNIVIIYE